MTRIARIFADTFFDILIRENPYHPRHPRAIAFMTLKTIALRNLMRRKGKAAFVLAGLLIGVATIVTVIGVIDGMTKDINDKLDQYGANILITPKTEHLTLSYGGIALGGVSFETQEIQETDLAQIKAIKNSANVAAVGPVALGVVTINAHTVLLAGVDMDVSYILKPWWHINGALPVDQEILLGSESARILQFAAGQRFDLNGQALTVAGILEPTGSQDDHLIFARLATAQTLLGKPGRVSMAEVAALCKDCPVEDMVDQIAAVLPGAKVMAIQQVVKGRMETLEQFKTFSYGVSGIILLVGSLVVLVTMMSSVRERTAEIGIFRAIGFRSSHVMQIVLLEATIISALAGVTGYLVGLGVTTIALRIFIENYTAGIPFNAQLALVACGLAVAMGLFASAYPALLASRLDPNEALRAL